MLWMPHTVIISLSQYRNKSSVVKYRVRICTLHKILQISRWSRPAALCSAVLPSESALFIISGVPAHNLTMGSTSCKIPFSAARWSAIEAAFLRSRLNLKPWSVRFTSLLHEALQHQAPSCVWFCWLSLDLACKCFASTHRPSHSRPSSPSPFTSTLLETPMNKTNILFFIKYATVGSPKPRQDSIVIRKAVRNLIGTNILTSFDSLPFLFSGPRRSPCPALSGRPTA